MEKIVVKKMYGSRLDYRLSISEFSIQDDFVHEDVTGATTRRNSDASYTYILIATAICFTLSALAFIVLQFVLHIAQQLFLS